MPWKIALATSETSARVGRGEATIEASIWVAVIEGREYLPASASSRRCTPGTCSIGSSIPRSPRATITPAVTALTISSARSAACGFSIFAITGMSEPPVRTRRSTGARSSARRTNETASRSIPLLDREVDPGQVLAARRRQADLGARAG